MLEFSQLPYTCRKIQHESTPPAVFLNYRRQLIVKKRAYVILHYLPNGRLHGIQLSFARYFLPGFYRQILVENYWNGYLLSSRVICGLFSLRFPAKFRLRRRETGVMFNIPIYYELSRRLWLINPDKYPQKPESIPVGKVGIHYVILPAEVEKKNVKKKSRKYLRYGTF